MDVRQQIGIRFSQQESGERRDLRIAQAVMRHRGLCVIRARIAQPSLQPSGLHFAADASQLGANVATHKIARGVLHRVARGAKGFSVQASAGRGISRCFR